MSPTNRYYPGFLAALFLVLLRVSIGWHFLYEGLYKYERIGTDQEFSSEGYLRNATGPLGETFRNLIPDVYGFDRLDPAKLAEAWNRRLEGYAAYHGFTPEQTEAAREKLAAAVDEARAWFDDSGNAQTVRRYRDEIERAIAIERDPGSLWFQRDGARELRSANEPTRRELMAMVQGWENDLTKAWDGLMTEAQAEEARSKPAFGQTFWDRWGPWNWDGLKASDMLTIIGLILMGSCLMLGLFTRFAALCGVAFLALIYMSSPPWPGLPVSPMSEGHYMIVNKNLIELLACAAFAALPTGHWVGLDAALFGARRRRKLAERAAREAERAAEREAVGASA